MRKMIERCATMSKGQPTVIFCSLPPSQAGVMDGKDAMMGRQGEQGEGRGHDHFILDKQRYEFMS